MRDCLDPILHALDPYIYSKLLDEINIEDQDWFMDKVWVNRIINLGLESKSKMTRLDDNRVLTENNAAYIQRIR